MDATPPSLTPREILEDPARVALLHDERACIVLAEAAHYVSRVLTVPNPKVGRAGAMCPFARSAIQRDMITLTILPLRTPDPASLRAAALSLKADFDLVGTATLSAKESLRAVMILLPYLDVQDAVDIVESVQKELKPVMVRHGLMIGEFYPGCALPGLNNPEFRPADTSFACLAIRRMTASDLPFLINDADFLESYLARFGEESMRKLNRAWPAPASGSRRQDADDTLDGLVPQPAEFSEPRFAPADRLDVRSL